MKFGARRRSGQSAIRWLRRATYVGSILGITWLAGFLWFTSQVPSAGGSAKTRTDAIVVLTGGTGRLDKGLWLLEKEFAGHLFVSGVARGVDVATLLRVAQRAPKELECCISIGYRADDTAGNAEETAGWVGKKGFNSIRLVTASYHMPRSLIEFRHAMPIIHIIPHPVHPPQFKRNQWWLWPGTAALLASEFNKYLIAAAGRSGKAAKMKDQVP
ncbi:YdcF family protein [Alphaproteobacteria bacterium]|nr:YdcF family protein [Alphaproteobacteria bacterium]